MRSLLLIPLQRLILSLWLWITDHIFPIQGQKKYSWISLSIGILCALSLFLYIPLTNIADMAVLDYTDTSIYPSAITLTMFLLYLMSILCITNITASFWQIHVGRTLNRRYICYHICIWALIIGGGYLILGHIMVAPIIIYYLLVAASEEGLKRISSLYISQHNSRAHTDIILFALLVALGFAFFENIIYVVQATLPLTTVQEQLSYGSSIALTRGLIGFIVHMLFTGSIAYISVYYKKWRGVPVALLGGIALHMSYNILLWYNITFIIGIYLVGGYILLSWLFWQSDSIYTNDT